MKIKIDIKMKSRYKYFLKLIIYKSLYTKPKNGQGKSYSDRTNKKTERQTDIENCNIDSQT